MYNINYCYVRLTGKLISQGCFQTVPPSTVVKSISSWAAATRHGISRLQCHVGWQFKERATPRGPGLVHVHAIKNIERNGQGQSQTKDDPDSLRKKLSLRWGGEDAVPKEG